MANVGITEEQLKQYGQRGRRCCPISEMNNNETAIMHTAKNRVCGRTQMKHIYVNFKTIQDW